MEVPLTVLVQLAMCNNTEPLDVDITKDCKDVPEGKTVWAHLEPESDRKAT